MATGNLGMSDLRAVRFSTAAQYGLNTINDVLQQDLANWENQVRESLGLFIETGTDRQRIWGSSATIDMALVDEYGKARTKKQLTGNTVAFKLNRYTSAVGYTDLWLKSHTPAEMVEQQLKIQRGHNERIMREIQRAIYANAAESFNDDLVDSVTLGIKPWINADGSLIPDAPDGSAFVGSSHTHFLKTAGATAYVNADIDALVKLVAEHGFAGIQLYINQGDLAAISALTGFTALSSPVMNFQATDSTIQRLDVNSDPSNRLVGYWGINAVPVFCKPWAVVSYVVCMSTDAPEKPLFRRLHTIPELQGLRLEATIDNYPLIADNYVALEGISVWNRLAGAVLYKGASYAVPTIS